MTIDEILANNEKYEKEKSEFLSSVKKKVECNVSENKLLTNIVNMSGMNLIIISIRLKRMN